MSEQAQAQAIAGRWEAFLGKVRQRMDEVVAEAEQGLDDIIATEVIDPGPVAQAIQAVRARVFGLQKKIDESWEKLEPEMEAVIDATDDREGDALRALRWECVRRGHAARDEMDERYETLRIRKEAKAARALYAIVEKEVAERRKCQACGAEFAVGAVREPMSVPCPYCKAVNTVRPGLATSMFYAGGKCHSLAEEAALEMWMEMRRAEKRFQRLRHPTDNDRAHFDGATAAYWRAYCEAYATFDPSWTPEQVEREFQGKLKQSRAFDNEGPARAARGEALRAAAAGDRAAVARIAQQKGGGAGSFVEEMVECGHEHGDRRATELLLDLSYDHERPDEGKAAWIRTRLCELDARLRDRV